MLKREVADGVWMSAGDETVNIWVPRLFAEMPISVSVGDLAVCLPEHMAEASLPAGGGPLQVVCLNRLRRRTLPGNVLLVLAHPGLFPTVRPKARLTTEGSLFHSGRFRPHDAYDFHCEDRATLLADLVREGVEELTDPYAWASERRHGLARSPAEVKVDPRPRLVTKRRVPLVVIALVCLCIAALAAQAASHSRLAAWASIVAVIVLSVYGWSTFWPGGIRRKRECRASSHEG